MFGLYQSASCQNLSGGLVSLRPEWDEVWSECLHSMSGLNVAYLVIFLNRDEIP